MRATAAPPRPAAPPALTAGAGAVRRRPGGLPPLLQLRRKTSESQRHARTHASAHTHEPLPPQSNPRTRCQPPNLAPPLTSPITHPSRPQVAAFDAFLHSHGALGGWDERDHGKFRKLLDKSARDYSQVVELAVAEFAGLYDRREIIQHARWDAEHEDLLLRKRDAIARWRAGKEAERAAVRARVRCQDAHAAEAAGSRAARAAALSRAAPGVTAALFVSLACSSYRRLTSSCLSRPRPRPRSARRLSRRGGGSAWSGTRHSPSGAPRCHES